VKKTLKKTLTLKAETLRELRGADIGRVAGGYTPQTALACGTNFACTWGCHVTLVSQCYRCAE
jgi:hypothetical protein